MRYGRTHGRTDRPTDKASFRMASPRAFYERAELSDPCTVFSISMGDLQFHVYDPFQRKNEYRETLKTRK